MSKSIGYEDYTALRKHKRRCCICGEPILVGDPCSRWTFVDGGDMTRLIAHQPCLRVQRKDPYHDEEWYGRFYFEDSPEGVEDCKVAVAVERSKVKEISV